MPNRHVGEKGEKEKEVIRMWELNRGFTVYKNI